jgi:hypothetical protein
MMASEWHGTAGMAEGQRTGQVLTVAAAAPSRVAIGRNRNSEAMRSAR